MNSLLGRIVKVSPAEGDIEVEFEPACLLPEHAAVPEWLVGKKLAIRRRVKDPREVGGIGDSIVLDPQESAPYLSPLTVEPAVCYGALPETLHLTYALPSEDKAPEFQAQGAGGTIKGAFEKDGALWRAEIKTASLVDGPLRPPATLKFTVDKGAATCVLFAAEGPVHGKIATPEGPAYRMENAWYAADISLSAGAGAVASFVEKGRNIDHFEKPANLTSLRQEAAGHLDRVHLGSAWEWFDKLRDTPAGSIGATVAGGAIRLDIESTLDDGQQVRTTAVQTLYDDIPLITLQRSYHKARPAQSDKKDDAPKAKIDEVTPIGFGFRTSWIVEREKCSGSRFLCVDGSRLAAIRTMEPNSFIACRPWSISGGWCLAEHPGRRAHMLYLFNTEDPPTLASWSGPQTITLEPYWPLIPLAPEQSVSLTLGLAAGEICGASPGGAWVACRQTAKGVVRLGIVARVAEPVENRAATVTLGGETKSVSLVPLLVAGIGTLHTAVAEFERADIAGELTATVAGIPDRRTQ